MIQNEFTRYAESASARYDMLTDSFRQLYTNAFTQADFGSWAQMVRIVKEAYQIAEIYLDNERETIDRILFDIATEAHQTTIREIASIDASELPERVSEHLGVTQRYLVDEIIAQVHRDIAQIRQRLQTAALEVSLSARSRAIPERRALIEFRIGNQSDLSFTFHDRTSRRWSSKKFIRAVWRHTLLAAYNESVMLTLADHGITDAIVSTVDAQAEAAGMRISFSSNSALPTYSEIRDTVFHPNSNAILAFGGLSVRS